MARDRLDRGGPQGRRGSAHNQATTASVGPRRTEDPMGSRTSAPTHPLDSYGCRRRSTFAGVPATWCSLPAFADALGSGADPRRSGRSIERLPYVTKVLLENL